MSQPWATHFCATKVAVGLSQDSSMAAAEGLIDPLRLASCIK
jgi:hypothetical protein